MDRSQTAQFFRQVQSFLQAAWRRKHIVLAITLLGGVLGGLQVVSSRSEPLTYAARGSLLLLQQLHADPQSALPMAMHIPIENYREILISDAVLEAAVKQLDSRPPEIDSELPVQEWPRKLREMLTIDAESRHSNVIQISCVSEDPGTPAKVINAIVRSTQEFLDRTQENMSLELVQSLDKERADLEVRLFSKERELFEAQQRTGTVNLGNDVETVHPLLQRTLQLNKSFLNAQRRRVELQAALAGVHKTVQEGGDLTPHLKPLEELLGDNRLQAAREYTDASLVTELRRRVANDEKQLAAMQKYYAAAHPNIVNLKESLRHNQAYLDRTQDRMRNQWNGLRDHVFGRQLLALVSAAVSVETEREATLQSIYEASEKQAIELNARLAKVQKARREVELLREMHGMILNRLAKIDVNEDRPSIRLSIMNKPTTMGIPVSRSSLAKTLIFVVVVSCGCGLAVVYVIDTLDDRFRSPEELTQQMNANLLGVIRELPKQSGEGIEALCVYARPNATESEGFRSLRTTLVFSGSGWERLAITSAEPHDGKTTVLANLGATCALAGKRTLLIDADLRSSGLTRLLAMRGPNGVSRILQTDGEISDLCHEAVRESGMEGLHVIPSGPRPSNPSELLSGPRLSELIAWAEMHYDQVLIDCPPILAASDAAIVGRLVDGLALVVQPPKNRRKLVLRAAEILRSTGVEIAGVIANRVSSEDGRGYGFGYGNGYRGAYPEHDEDGVPIEDDQSPSQSDSLSDSRNAA